MRPGEGELEQELREDSHAGRNRSLDSTRDGMVQQACHVHFLSLLQQLIHLHQAGVLRTQNQIRLPFTLNPFPQLENQNLRAQR